MSVPDNNDIAYIDGANLHKGVASSNWKMDYRHFRSWIRQKYGITEAKLFIGLMPKNAGLYTSLQHAGFHSFSKKSFMTVPEKRKGIAMRISSFTRYAISMSTNYHQ